MQALAVGPNEIFWTDDNGRIWSYSKHGGTARLVTTVAQGDAQELAASGNALFWIQNNQSHLMRKTLPDGPIEQLAAGGSGPCVDTERVYFGSAILQGCGVWALPLTAQPGATPTQVSSGCIDGAMLVYKAMIYAVIESANVGGEVGRVPTAGGSVQQIASGDGNIGAIAVAAGRIYVLWGHLIPQTGTGQSGISVFGLDGSYETSVGSAPAGLAADGTVAYWTEGDGRVLARLPSATVRQVASDQNAPEEIAVGNTCVYWATSTSIVAAPKIQ